MVRNIPVQLSLLDSLQVLDLADNKLSGTLPPSFGNFRAMTVIPDGAPVVLYEDLAKYDFYAENVQITAEGQELKSVHYCPLTYNKH